MNSRAWLPARLAGAVVCFDKALALAPRLADAAARKGDCLRTQNDLRGAIEAFRQALAIEPSLLAARVNLGAALRLVGELSEAERHLREAAHRRPDSVQAHANLGLVQLELGRTGEAIESLNRAAGLDGNNADAQNNLGNALLKKGDLVSAECHVREALRLAPGHAEARLNLGNLLARGRKYADAAECYRLALHARPDYADAFYNLGNLHRETGDLDKAIECYEKTLSLCATHLAALTNLAESLQVAGEMDRAEECVCRALAIEPGCELAHDNFLACVNYSPRYAPGEVFEAHRKWGARLTCSPRITSADPSPQRRLRVGYVSPDFCRHPAGSFLLPLLQSHDHSALEIFCYAQVKSPDERTELFRGASDHWRDTNEMTDDDLAGAVRKDAIDVLVDCAGHTAGNRLTVFARRPAPVQVSYLGYPSTTGLESMDWYLTDTLCDPPGAERLYTEQIARIDGGFCAWTPPDNAPPVSEPPVGRAGCITFGSLHTLARLNADVVALWARVLAAVPGSRLLIFRTTLTERIAARLRESFEGAGVASERLVLTRTLPTHGYLGTYDEIDIALDTFPWSGHTTACEALWMGVPTVTLLGDRHAGRMAASVLTQAGMDRCVARTAEEYIDIARALCGDVAALRSSLRRQVAESKLCDGRRLAAEVEKQFRAMWVRRGEERGAG